MELTGDLPAARLFASSAHALHTASQENSTNNSLMTSNPYICSSKQNSFPQHSSPKPDCIKTPAGNLDVQSQCPVCGLVFDNHDNTEINSHIDSCLNATTVKQLAKAEDGGNSLGEAKVEVGEMAPDADLTSGLPSEPATEGALDEEETTPPEGSSK
jgi:hypothetical protein